MKRPPDRKLVLLAMVLLLAASAVFGRAANVQDNGENRMSLSNTLLSTGAR